MWLPHKWACGSFFMWPQSQTEPGTLKALINIIEWMTLTMNLYFKTQETHHCHWKCVSGQCGLDYTTESRQACCTRWCGPASSRALPHRSASSCVRSSYRAPPAFVWLRTLPVPLLWISSHTSKLPSPGYLDSIVMPSTWFGLFLLNISCTLMDLQVIKTRVFFNIKLKLS